MDAHGIRKPVFLVSSSSPYAEERKIFRKHMLNDVMRF
nr:hypothetical protein [uncultured bacterium]